MSQDWDEGMSMFSFLTETCKAAIDKLGLVDYDEQLLALQLWSSVHGLVNLALTDRLAIVEKYDGQTLIEKTLEANMISIFRK